MIDEIGHEELTEWIALAELDGWGQDDRRFAALQQTMHNGFLMLAAKMGLGINYGDWKSRDAFMPRIGNGRPASTGGPFLDPSSPEARRMVAGLCKR